MNARVLDVAVIGGGCSATALAAVLARQAPSSYRASVFSRTPIGPGTAYAPQSAALLMNGPVRAMSVVAGDDEHLARYLVDEPGDALICRARFGAYLRATAASALAAHPGISHEATEIVDIEAASHGYRVTGADGRVHAARSVVFALGNLPPSDSFLPDAVRSHAGYAGDPWSASVESFDPSRGVAIIGSRLTALDTIALLDEVAYRGHIHLISRHALIPAVEDTTVRAADPRSLALDTSTPRSLLRSVRRAVARHSGDWRAVIEALRPISPAVWQSWSHRERRRFLRHLQSLWAIHRYRVPAATFAAFERMRAEGQITIHRGRIASAKATGSRMALRIAARESSYEIGVGYAINCTGPNGDLSTVSHPLVRSAIARGLLRPDALRLGADVTNDYRLVDGRGRPQESAYAIGPLLRGLWFETTAVSEIRAHAVAIAERLLAQRDALAAARDQAVSF
jgi:uncharacterized NAD(P)/FAD-binding protein YdhS